MRILSSSSTQITHVHLILWINIYRIHTICSHRAKRYESLPVKRQIRYKDIMSYTFEDVYRYINSVVYSLNKMCIYTQLQVIRESYMYIVIYIYNTYTYQFLLHINFYYMWNNTDMFFLLFPGWKEPNTHDQRVVKTGE